MKTLILGAGYVGVPSAAHFASGHQVMVYDPNKRNIDAANQVLNGGNELHIHEKGLIELLQKNRDNLTFTNNVEEAFASNPELIFNCVGTPEIKQGPNKGRANLEYLISAGKSIGEHLQSPAIVLNKSTVPPGSAYLVEKIIKENLNADVNYQVGSCPEFLAEGTAIKDLQRPSRIVFGIDNKEARSKVENYFRDLHRDAPIISMNTTSSEITKYAANAMLATRISFMNDLAHLCEYFGADIEQVRKGISSDPRVGSKFLYASLGYGGSCFPKDTKALSELSKIIDLPLSIIQATIDINENNFEKFYKKILDDNRTLEGKEFGLWGVAFKKGTNDIRESKAIELAKELMNSGAKIHVYDEIPGAVKEFVEDCREFEGAFRVYDHQYGIFNQPLDGLIIGNDSDQFRNPNIQYLNSMKRKAIYDGKNFIAEHKVLELDSLGFMYRSVGRDALTQSADKDKIVHLLEKEYMV